MASLGPQLTSGLDRAVGYPLADLHTCPSQSRTPSV
jgi:hypothetical protein